VLGLELGLRLGLAEMRFRSNAFSSNRYVHFSKKTDIRNFEIIIDKII